MVAVVGWTDAPRSRMVAVVGWTDAPRGRMVAVVGWTDAPRGRMVAVVGWTDAPRGCALTVAGWTGLNVRVCFLLSISGGTVSRGLSPAAAAAATDDDEDDCADERVRPVSLLRGSASDESSLCVLVILPTVLAAIIRCHIVTYVHYITHISAALL